MLSYEKGRNNIEVEYSSSDIDGGSSSTSYKGRNYVLSGAGVVPVMLCKTTKRVCLLLGRERYVRGWSSSLKWSGFEGSNSGKESAEENAAREAVEESSDLVFSDKEVLKQELIAGKYIAKITVRNRSTRKMHITFLKMIPYDPTLPAKFLAKMELLNNISAINGRIAVLRKKRINANPGADASDDSDPGWSKVERRGADNISMSRLQRQLENLLGSSTSISSSVVIERDDQQKVSGAIVKDEYIEKSQIKIVTIREFRDIVKVEHMEHGTSSMSLRPYFRVVAKMIVNCLPDSVEN